MGLLGGGDSSEDPAGVVLDELQSCTAAIERYRLCKMALTLAGAGLVEDEAHDREWPGMSGLRPQNLELVLARGPVYG
jgi:hypothetical protein